MAFPSVPPPPITDDEDEDPFGGEPAEVIDVRHMLAIVILYLDLALALSCLAVVTLRVRVAHRRHQRDRRKIARTASRRVLGPPTGRGGMAPTRTLASVAGFRSEAAGEDQSSGVALDPGDPFSVEEVRSWRCGI